MKHTLGMLKCFHLEHFDIYLGGETKTANMDISVDYKYLTATICINKGMAQLYKIGNREEILTCLCHEITHILTGVITDGIALDKQQTKQDEQATEHLSRLLYRLYRRRQ